MRYSWYSWIHRFIGAYTIIHSKMVSHQDFSPWLSNESYSWKYRLSHENDLIRGKTWRFLNWSSQNLKVTKQDDPQTGRSLKKTISKQDDINTIPENDNCFVHKKLRKTLFFDRKLLKSSKNAKNRSFLFGISHRWDDAQIQIFEIIYK